MNKPTIPLLLISACFAFGCISVGHVLPEPTEWKFLGGLDDTGWVQHGGKAAFEFRSGEIIGQSRPNQPNSFLCTLEEYSNFELEYDFKVNRHLNSGVQIRSHVRDKGIVYGYQVEIDPSDRAFTGGIYEESGRGWLCDLKDNPDARAAFKQNDWNHIRVIAFGDHIQTWLNGVLAADLHDAIAQSGFIGLQVHNVGAETDQFEVRWKNLRIRNLPLEKPPVPRIQNPTFGMP